MELKERRDTERREALKRDILTLANRLVSKE